MEVANYYDRERPEFYDKHRKGRSLISDAEGIYLHQDGYWMYSYDLFATYCRITDEQAAHFRELLANQ
jgi:hypothetical protein